MPIQINCPSCKGAVRVPEDLLGRRVQCPRCQVTFVAEVEEEGPPPLPKPAAADDGDATEATAKPRPRRPVGDDDFDDDYEYRPRRRRYGRPHRGGAVLALGILSLVVCSPLGIFAWAMGNTDLDQMRRGEMDREGEGLTQAGKICGIVGTVILILQCLFFLGYFSLFMAFVGARF